LAAAADLYLTVPSAPGDVTDAGHAGAIRAFSLDWATTAETSWTKGGGASVGKPNPGLLHLTIATGAWSNVLMQAITTGKTLDGPPAPGPIVIDATVNGHALYRMTLQGVFLTRYQTQFDPQKGPVDAIDLVFKTASIERTYTDAKGTTSFGSNLTWDIPAGTVGAAIPAPTQAPPMQAPTVAPQLKPRTN
jgi:type VI protein secretion system component Hcp